MVVIDVEQHSTYKQLFYHYVASVNLTLTGRNTSRDDIDCPGDTITYRCFIVSNSETVQLTWRVTLPGMMPVNITYDNTSIPNTVGAVFGNNITTTLTNFKVDEFIESTFVFTVLRDVAINETVLECFSEDLDMSTDVVFVNISGT